MLLSLSGDKGEGVPAFGGLTIGEGGHPVECSIVARRYRFR